MAGLVAGGASEAERKQEILATLEAISQSVMAGPLEAAALVDICGAICRHTEWSICGVIRVDRDKGVNHLLARYDPLAGAAEVTHWPLATSPVQHVLDTGAPLVLADIDRHETYRDYREDARRRGYKTLVLAPLVLARQGGEHLCLSLKSYGRIDVGPGQIELIRSLCTMLGPLVHQVAALDRQRQAATRRRQLLKAAIDCGSAEAFSTAVENIGDCGFLLYSRNTCRLVLHAPKGGGAAFPWEGDVPSWLRADDIMRRLEAAKGPLRIALGPEDGSGPTDLEFHPLESGADLLGFMAFPAEAGAPDEVDLRASLTVAAAFVLKNQRPVISDRDRLAELLFGRLLADPRQSAYLLEDLQALTGLDFGKPLNVAIMRPTSDGMFDLQDIAALARQQLSAFSAAVAIEDGSVWILGQSTRLCRRATKYLGDALLERSGGKLVLIEHEAPGGSNDLPSVLAECRRLLCYAVSHRLSGRLKPNDVGPATLLLSTIGESEAQAFVHATLGALTGQDDSRTGEFLKTLHCFLEEEGRLTATAARLGIHITTLRYRLDRICGSLGLDLSSSAKRFELRLALNLHGVSPVPQRRLNCKSA